MTSLTQEYRPYIEAIFGRKPKSVTALHVEDLTSYTDMVVVVEAGSRRQVTSLAEHMIKTLKGNKIKALGAEGVKEGEWALLDYGHIIVHVFESGAKDFYDLEGLWSDAPRVDLEEFGPLAPEEDDEDDDDF
ncbi:MAG: ribosome silencing factor [Desulfobacter sp.]|nr:MAG: ribosome silencing factor [Desulfobacter sp.]